MTVSKLVKFEPVDSPLEARFNRAAFAFHAGFKRLNSFRVLASEGLSHGWPRLLEQYDTGIRGMTSLFPDASTVLEAGAARDGFIQLLRTTTEADARAVIDEVSVILGHTYFDELLSNFCAIAAEASPERMKHRLRQRKVSLADALSGTPEDLLARLTRAHLDELEREPIRKRFGLLLDLAPLDVVVYPGNYTFNLDRIERFDSLRQDIVHQRKPPSYSEPAEEALAYLQGTVFYLSAVLNQHFGLSLSLVAAVSASSAGA